VAASVVLIQGSWEHHISANQAGNVCLGTLVDLFVLVYHVSFDGSRVEVFPAHPAGWLLSPWLGQRQVMLRNLVTFTTPRFLIAAVVLRPQIARAQDLFSTMRTLVDLFRHVMVKVGLTDTRGHGRFRPLGHLERHSFLYHFPIRL